MKNQNHLDWSFDDFENLTVLAQGFTGPIYKCENKKLKNRFFILKTYKIDEFSPGEDLVKKEVSIFEKIPLFNKPAILPNFYGCLEKITNEKQKVFYTIFDYYDFQETIIKKSQRIDFIRLYEYFLSTIQGLCFLQKKGIAHKGITTEALKFDSNENIYLISFLNAEFIDPEIKNNHYKWDVFCLARVFLELANAKTLIKSQCEKGILEKEVEDLVSHYKNEIKN